MFPFPLRLEPRISLQCFTADRPGMDLGILPVHTRVHSWYTVLLRKDPAHPGVLASVSCVPCSTPSTGLGGGPGHLLLSLLCPAQAV